MHLSGIRDGYTSCEDELASLPLEEHVLCLGEAHGPRLRLVVQIVDREVTATGFDGLPESHETCLLVPREMRIATVDCDIVSFILTLSKSVGLDWLPVKTLILGRSSKSFEGGKDIKVCDG